MSKHDDIKSKKKEKDLAPKSYMQSMMAEI